MPKCSDPAQVLASLVEALDLRVTAADQSISATYEKASGPRKRYILARIDGLTNPKERQSSKSAIRRLERLVEHHRKEQEYIRRMAASGPPVSPETIDKIVRLTEVAHVEEMYFRMPGWDGQSPIHGGG